MSDSRVARALLLVLLCAIVIGPGFLSLMIGADANSDLRNYHLYVPYSVLNDRIGVDIAPAMRQSYINPALDFVYYGLAWGLNDYPRLVAFLYALPFGVCGALIFWISWRVMAGPVPLTASWQSRLPEVLAAVAIGASGATGQSTLGNTMHEAQVTLFVLVALLLAVIRLQGTAPRPLSMICLGLCVGIAGGFKLSYAPHGLAIGLALVPFVLWRRIGIGELLLSALGVLLGLLISFGPWAWFLYDTFQNPLFPFFNHIFESPYAEPERWSDDRYLPGSLLEALRYPLSWAMGDGTEASEMPFRDLRFVTAAGLGVLAGIALLVVGRREGTARRPEMIFLIIYALLAYAIWVSSFGIYRYALPLEMLSGLFIAAAVLVLARHLISRRVVLGCLAVLMLVTTAPVNWGRAPFGDKVLHAEPMDVPENSVVVLLGDRPTGYLLALMPEGTLGIGLENNFLKSSQDNLLTRQAFEILSTHDGPLRAVTTLQEIPESQILERAGVRVVEETCERVVTSLSPAWDWEYVAVRLCRMERTGGSTGADSGAATN